MAKYRRATITSPSTNNVVDFSFNKNNRFDRRSADNVLYGVPVMTKKEGSGSFTLCSGAWTDLYNETLVVVVEDVAVANKVETITSRTFTFSNVTTNSGIDANNDGGESSRKVSFEFGTVVES